MHEADVVVVGSGVIGLSIAWQLQRAGRDVVVVDPRPGRGASYAAAGMLAPVTEASATEGELLELSLRAAKDWPSFAGALEAASGFEVGLVESGTLLVGLDAGDRAALEELADLQASLGLSVSVLSPSAAREHEPLLAPSVSGGILAADDHQVDNRRLLASLAQACRREGVQPLAERVDALVLEAGRVTGVETARGSVLAPVVVIAAGWSSGSIAGIAPGVLAPLRPVKGEILRLRASAAGPAPARVVRAIAKGSKVYVVPRSNGGVVVGATMLERGEETSVSAGSVHSLLRDALRVLPCLAEAELEEALAGLRPGSPDNLPIVGATSCQGLVLATGHFRNGILLAPVTAEAVLALLDGGELPGYARAMDPRRFDLSPRQGHDVDARPEPPGPRLRETVIASAGDRPSGAGGGASGADGGAGDRPSGAGGGGAVPGDLVVSCNGEQMILAPGATVLSMLEVLGLDRRKVAVALNGEVVARSSWACHVLSPGDRIELLTIAQGG